jgi:ketosteroid isomerase-like protein
MSDPHPARAAAARSMDAVHRKDRAAWLANFADDAVVEDPIGPSPLDPKGEGVRGKAAIAAFWDRAIAPNRVLFAIARSYACGSEVANVGTITIVLPNGAVSQVDGVFTYRVDAAGKLAALRAYWELAGMRVFPPAGAAAPAG